MVLADGPVIGEEDLPDAVRGAAGARAPAAPRRRTATLSVKRGDPRAWRSS